jgi:FtsZ-binding cell division protein ZapB
MVLHHHQIYRILFRQQTALQVTYLTAVEALAQNQAKEASSRETLKIVSRKLRQKQIVVQKKLRNLLTTL